MNCKKRTNRIKSIIFKKGNLVQIFDFDLNEKIIGTPKENKQKIKKIKSAMKNKKASKTNCNYKKRESNQLVNFDSNTLNNKYELLSIKKDTSEIMANNYISSNLKEPAINFMNESLSYFSKGKNDTYLSEEKNRSQTLNFISKENNLNEDGKNNGLNCFSFINEDLLLGSYSDDLFDNFEESDDYYF